MKQFNLKNQGPELFFQLAGFTIKIEFGPSDSPFPQVYWREKFLNKYRNWVTQGKKPHDAVLKYTQQNLYLGKAGKTSYVKLYEWKKPLIMETYYYISHTQLLYLLQVFLKKLLQKTNGYLIHASANKLPHNCSYLFIGQSTAGKTTISNLLNSEFPKLTDDISVLKKEIDGYYLYQIPLDSIVSIQPNNPNKFKVAALFFLQKAKKSKIIPISDIQELITKIVPSIWIEKQQEITTIIKQLPILLNSSSRLYVLEFTKNKDELINFFKKLPKIKP